MRCETAAQHNEYMRAVQQMFVLVGQQHGKVGWAHVGKYLCLLAPLPGELVN